MHVFKSYNAFAFGSALILFHLVNLPYTGYTLNQIFSDKEVSYAFLLSIVTALLLCLMDTLPKLAMELKESDSFLGRTIFRLWGIGIVANAVVVYIGILRFFQLGTQVTAMTYILIAAPILIVMFRTYIVGTIVFGQRR